MFYVCYLSHKFKSQPHILFKSIYIVLRERKTALNIVHVSNDEYDGFEWKWVFVVVVIEKKKC